MVKLTRIYTRTGDEGITGLSDFSRVRKTDPRIEAYADVDEANSALGLALAHHESEFDKPTVSFAKSIQNQLFDLGADLATPLAEKYEHRPIRITQSHIDALETEIDRLNDKLAKLDSFIIPGGSKLAAGLHLARTVVRRAERATWHAIEKYGIDPAASKGMPGGINVLTGRYLNRLSDYLFVLARTANLQSGTEIKWIPESR
jgi:cob(I)alamin adenosyltransferase